MLPALVALTISSDIDFLRTVAREVVDGCVVRPGEALQGGQKNTTGLILRVPGATRDWYPAFWVRDAAMMLGCDLVAAPELEGWISVVAKTQPGAEGLRFGELKVPPYSIPDHITLGGKACWFPGAYEEQGDGSFGFLPPADNAFYFIQMIAEHCRLTKSTAILDRHFETAYGKPTLREIALAAYGSVEVDADGLVLCRPEQGSTRVDWGFCDTIRKTGRTLMPSLLRWKAATDLADLLRQSGRKGEAAWLEKDAGLIATAIPRTFAAEVGQGKSLLLSATEIGRKADLWASCYAAHLGVLPNDVRSAVCRGVEDVVKGQKVVFNGQLRSIPTQGPLGGNWDRSLAAPDTYQNGGYWGTPTGWLISTLRRVDRTLADAILHDYAEHIRQERGQGAPFEWIHPNGARQNPRYAASIALVISALPKG